MPVEIAAVPEDAAAILPPSYRVALAYAPRVARPSFRALFLLHFRCGSLVGRASEPLPTQFRLSWHRSILQGETVAGRPDPGMEEIMAGWGPEPYRLVPVIDAWEEVLGESADLCEASRAAAEPLRAIAYNCGCDALECEASAKAGRRWIGTELALARRSRGEIASLPEEADHIALPRAMRPLAILDGLARRVLLQRGNALMGDRLSPFAAMRLGILGR